MKKTLLLVLMCSVLFACSDDENEEYYNPLNLNKTAITISDEKATIIDIGDKSGGYTLALSNENIVAAVITDDYKLYIWGGLQGNADVTVGNKNGEMTIVKVTVDRNISRPMPTTQLIMIKIGDSYAFTPEIPVSSILFGQNENENVVTVEDLSDKLKFNGLRVGESTISFYDTNLYSCNYKVQVVEKFKLEPKTNIVNITRNESVTLFINGNGGYQIEVGDEKNITATVREYTEAERAEREGVAPYGAFIDIKGLVSDTMTSIKITDADNQSVEVVVRIL